MRAKQNAVIAMAATVFTGISHFSDAATSIFRYDNVFEAHATDNIISVQGMQRYNEGEWGTTYWGPTGANILGSLVMRFQWSEPTESVYLEANLESYNFGEGAYGESYFYASVDGVSYTKIIDNPMTPNLESLKSFSGYLPQQFVGTSELYFKVELQQTVAPGFFAYSQFSRKARAEWDPFVLEVKTIPELSGISIFATGILILAFRRKRFS